MRQAGKAALRQLTANEAFRPARGVIAELEASVSDKVLGGAIRRRPTGQDQRRSGRSKAALAAHVRQNNASSLALVILVDLLKDMGSPATAR